MRDELFLAARGGGASLDGVPLRPSGCTEPGEALLVTGFPYDVHQEHQELLRVFATLLTRARGIRRFGAAALDLAWVACGRFDGFWETKLKPWDLAAGVLLGREAGAVVTDLDGGERVLDGGSVLIAPPALHARLLALVRQARR
jgi:myo-inositol-1(or 4)-monophosphatase